MLTANSKFNQSHCIKLRDGAQELKWKPGRTRRPSNAVTVCVCVISGFRCEVTELRSSGLLRSE
jgi:hypothetical protein